MYIRTEKRLVEIEDRIYIANDGTEFKTETECVEYEKQLDIVDLRERADKLRLNALDGTYPLDTDAQYINDNHSYTWYQVCDEEDYNVLLNLYGDDVVKPCSYPEIICVEYEEDYGNDVWTYLLSDMMQSTLIFWKNFGYDVSFKGVREL